MFNIALLYGTLSGLVVIIAIIGTIVFGDQIAGGHSEWLGYLIMFIALSMIFFGIKRYRDRELGGVIKFVPALIMGLSIAVVAGIIYVMVWEVYLAATNYAFIDSYTAGMLERMRASGASEAEIAEQVANVKWMKEVYANPPYRMAMTFIEIFPVGVLVALVSAAILRNPRALPATA